MNEFETLDNELTQDEVSLNLKELASKIGLWAKIIAIVNLVIQAITFVLDIITTGQVSSIIGVGISIALYLSLLKFSQHISEFSEDGTVKSLEKAIERERIYWQFVGIICIIAFAFLSIAFVILGGEISAIMDAILQRI